MADKEKCVGELSAFLIKTACKVETMLHRLKWKKEKLLKEVYGKVYLQLFAVDRKVLIFDDAKNKPWHCTCILWLFARRPCGSTLV